MIKTKYPLAGNDLFGRGSCTCIYYLWEGLSTPTVDLAPLTVESCPDFISNVQLAIDDNGANSLFKFDISENTDDASRTGVIDIIVQGNKKRTILVSQNGRVETGGIYIYAPRIDTCVAYLMGTDTLPDLSSQSTVASWYFVIPLYGGNTVDMPYDFNSATLSQNTLQLNLLSGLWRISPISSNTIFSQYTLSCGVHGSEQRWVSSGYLYAGVYPSPDIAILKIHNGQKKLSSIRMQKCLKNNILQTFSEGSGIMYQGILYILKHL